MENHNDFGILEIMIFTYLNPDGYRLSLKKSGELLKNERLSEPKPERKDIKEIIPQEVIEILKMNKSSEEGRNRIKKWLTILRQHSEGDTLRGFGNRQETT